VYTMHSIIDVRFTRRGAEFLCLTTAADAAQWWTQDELGPARALVDEFLFQRLGRDDLSGRDGRGDSWLQRFGPSSQDGRGDPRFQRFGPSSQDKHDDPRPDASPLLGWSDDGLAPRLDWADDWALEPPFAGPRSPDVSDDWMSPCP